MIVNADAIAWAKEQEAETFHALLCDPPYHLTSISSRVGKEGAAQIQFGTDGAFRRATAGFMGQKWDGGDLCFQSSTWAAFLRLLMPGAFGFAFCGSRGWHRQAVAIEEAGFILHPTVFLYAFGCLSEDTEILTSEGWKLYPSILTTDTVMCYNVDERTFGFMPIQEKFVYDYNETAYRIQSDRTDQLVSRNHRCLVERAGCFEFVYAEALQREETVPILENVPDLLDSLRGDGQRRSTQEAFLLPALRDGVRKSKAARQDVQAEQSASEKGVANKTGIHLREPRLSQGVSRLPIAAQREKRLLLPLLQSETRDCPSSPGEKRRQSCAMDGGTQAAGLCRNDGREESRMEGRSNVLSEARQLCDDQIRSVPLGIYRHGAKRRIRDGASAIRRASVGQMPDTGRSCSPCQPRPEGQQPFQPSTFCVEPSTQTVRASRHTSSCLASVTPVHYRGKVWCVSVPTGAFVARRNGHVFITGNSGFPKATRIGKFRDGETVKRTGKSAVSPGAFAGNHPERIPDSEVASVFSQHRYGLQAMKPAVEPILLFQRPYRGRPIDNITLTGAGALNIGAGRIGTNGEKISPFGTPTKSSGGILNTTNALRNPFSQDCGGRWPSNLLLGDSCAASALDRQSGVSVSKQSMRGVGLTGSTVYGSGDLTLDTMRGHADGGGASRFFFQVRRQIDEAEPVRYCSKPGRRERDSGCDSFELRAPDNAIDRASQRKGLEPSSGRGSLTKPQRNNHPTVKPLDLTRYLASLLLPPAEFGPRRLLVPFSGVASEVIGARLAGWEDVTGIEQSAEYCKIAEARIRFWDCNSGLFSEVIAENEKEDSQQDLFAEVEA